jgi:hypothetical protein
MISYIIPYHIIYHTYTAYVLTYGKEIDFVCLCKKKIKIKLLFVCFFFFISPPKWFMASSFTRFLDHTQRRTTVGRIPPDERSVRRRDLYLYTLQHSQQRDNHAPSGIQTHDLNKRAAADLRLRPRNHWDRQN